MTGILTICCVTAVNTHTSMYLLNFYE